MAYAFRSVGTVVTGFNSTITPGAPAGFQAGDLLIYAAWEFVGSNGPPDLSASNFTLLSDGTSAVVKGCALYGKIAVGGDTIPGINYGNQRTGALCAAYTGAPTTISSISNISPVTRASTATSSVFWNSATPTIGGCLLIALLCRNQSGSSAVSFGGTQTPWTFRAGSTPAAASAPVAYFGDWIQTNSASTGSGSITTSPADAGAQSVFSQIITLNPPPPPAGGGGTGTAFPPAQRKKYIYYNNYYPR